MVGDIHQASAALLDAVAEGRPVVSDKITNDPSTAQLPDPLGDLVQYHPRRRVGEPEGEERRRQVPSELLLEGLGGRARAPEMDVGTRDPERRAEARSDD